ncbi:hypothetical protein CSB69_3405 [Morganella morganii]|nr:hypothetical protein CSB69_3405 [Morganella morganii]
MNNKNISIFFYSLAYSALSDSESISCFLLSNLRNKFR